MLKKDHAALLGRTLVGNRTLESIRKKLKVLEWLPPCPLGEADCTEAGEHMTRDSRQVARERETSSQQRRREGGQKRTQSATPTELIQAAVVEETLIVTSDDWRRRLLEKEVDQIRDTRLEADCLNDNAEGLMQGHLSREAAISSMNAHTERNFPSKWISRPIRRTEVKSLTSRRLIRRVDYANILVESLQRCR